MQDKRSGTTYRILDQNGAELSSGECEVIDEREPGSFCFGDVVLNATGSIERPLTRSEDTDTGSATNYSHLKIESTFDAFLNIDFSGFTDAMASFADFMKSQSANDSFYDLLELKPDPPSPISEAARMPIIPIQAKEARGPP